MILNGYSDSSHILLQTDGDKGHDGLKTCFTFLADFSEKPEMQRTCVPCRK